MRRLASLAAATGLAVFWLGALATAQAAEPAAACAALNGLRLAPTELGLPTRGAIVDKAELVLASAANPFGEYCRAEGRILSVDEAAQPIRFSVALPTAWNRWAIQLGGGAENGFVIRPDDLKSPVHLSVLPQPFPLAKGYLAYGSDSGHQGASDDTAYRANAEELANFNGDQIKKTHDVAMALAQRRYAATPEKNLFAGGSTGGFEAMVAVQRFPDDYDGAIIWGPGIVEWTNWHLKGVEISRAMMAGNGAGLIGAEQARRLRAVTLAACDRLDGLEDGVVSNVDACRIDMAALRCAVADAPEAGCFNPLQIRTLEALLSSTPALPYKVGGRTLGLHGYELGTDFETLSQIGPRDKPGFFPWQVALTPAEFAPAPGQPVTALDPLHPPKALLDRLARNPTQEDWGDIDRFVARGGKLIMIIGRSDFAASTPATIAQYQRLVARYGRAKADEFSRFYLIPGYSHGSGVAFNANGTPTLPALEQWLKTGEAPGALTAVDLNPGARARTRPVCLYPTWPRYDGTGDPDKAASFRCVP